MAHRRRNVRGYDPIPRIRTLEVLIAARLQANAIQGPYGAETFDRPAADLSADELRRLYDALTDPETARS